jgi:hypothetical protein
MKELWLNNYSKSDLRYTCGAQDSGDRLWPKLGGFRPVFFFWCSMIDNGNYTMNVSRLLRTIAIDIASVPDCNLVPTSQDASY